MAAAVVIYMAKDAKKPGNWTDEEDNEGEVESTCLLHLVKRVGEAGWGVQQDGKDHNANQQLCSMKKK